MLAGCRTIIQLQGPNHKETNCIPRELVSYSLPRPAVAKTTDSFLNLQGSGVYPNFVVRLNVVCKSWTRSA